MDTSTEDVVRQLVAGYSDNQLTEADALCRAWRDESASEGVVMLATVVADELAFRRAEMSREVANALV